jgi:hypothetical protein
MKICVTIMVVSILIVIVFILNLKADDVIQGTYEPNVVLSVPWGEKNLSYDEVASKPGEFGFGVNAESLAVGPTAFTVASNGDIYIGDALNDRVQRFSSQGSFIKTIPNAWGSSLGGFAVDQDGNIYSPYIYTENPAVYKFDQNGNRVMIYPIAKDEEMGIDRYYSWSPNSISCDDSGRVFVQYTVHSGTPRSFQIGTKDAVYSPAQQKATINEAAFGATANVPNMNKILREVGLLGVDKDAVFTIQKDEQNPNISIIRKSTYDGRPIGVYSLDWSKVKCDLITSASMNSNSVFDKGNIYNFCSDKEGIKIIKWSAVEGK